jgi:hypothetical protein
LKGEIMQIDMTRKDFMRELCETLDEVARHKGVHFKCFCHLRSLKEYDEKKFWSREMIQCIREAFDLDAIAAEEQAWRAENQEERIREMWEDAVYGEGI